MSNYSLGRYRVVIPLIALIALSGCSSAISATESENIQASTETSASDLDLLLVDEDGISDIDVSAVSTILQTSDNSALTSLEAEGLQFMREEEKLAHDLYIDLYEIWGIPIFNNIANSEATHTAAVKELLDYFGIEDPAEDDLHGVFRDSELQALYDQLLADGSRSLEDAFLVGALVEEVDIKDLEVRMEQTDETQILNVYTNLIAGSRNHLRSFVSQYESRTGQSYQSQFLDDSVVQLILASPAEKGKGRPSN